MLIRSIAALVLAGCAAVPAVPMSASAEAREVLAPTGRLRAGLYQGVGRDLARELAWQLRVPLDDVAFERHAELIEALRAGQIDVGFTSATPEPADMVFVPTGTAGGAIAVSKGRGRAVAFLRDFVDDARRRALVN
jgi:polar amino acid transport system substrate-binding protein